VIRRLETRRAAVVVSIAGVLGLGAAALIACGSGGDDGSEPVRAVPPVADPSPESAGWGEGRGPDRPPNFVVIETDDQAMSLYRRAFMPLTKRLIEEQGTWFANSFALPPLCCPSRATLITGQYPHTHGILGNNPGYPDLREPANVLPAWLQRAGYRTGLIGKYLNGTRAALGLEPAPGWDRWYESGDAPTYFGPLFSVDGERRHYAGDRYVTSLINDEAVQFVTEAARDGVPFFAWVAHWAPHQKRDPGAAGCGRGTITAEPLPADERRYSDLPFPPPPGFDERNVADKPPRIQRLPSLSARDRRAVARSWRCRGAALREVDRGVGEIYEALERAGVLEDTVIVFTSDNGFYFGEHRLPARKGGGFEAALRVPLAIRVGRNVIRSGSPGAIREPVGNLDLAPTLVELAGATPCIDGEGCRRLDGRSLTALLRGRAGGWPRDRALLNELDEACHLIGIRTVRWSAFGRGRVDDDGRCRLRANRNFQVYDMRADPAQLRNLAESRPRLVEELRARAERLAACSGIRGREPRAPGFEFCD
jgi:N-acetylglucosamine-6-sulfatase